MRLFGWIKSLFSRPITQGELMQAEGTILTEDKVKKFIDSRLGGQDLPKDLSSLMAAIASDPEFEKSGDNPLKIIRAEALWTDKKYSLLDHDYINGVDRLNPDIMANVRAMQDTDKKLKFVVQCEDTSLIGYWQPDPETPLEQCALFWLDTEGQYYLAEGKTLSASLAYRALIEGNEDTYQSLRDAFERLGVTVPEGDETRIFADMDVREAKIGETPKIFRNQRYEYYESLR